jgi:nitrite reductase/ring-hydroxylating ferredoxin subunit
MAKFFKVATIQEIPLGTSKLIEKEGRIFSVYHLKEGWFALDDRCPHRSGPLGEGTVSEGVVTCPWHGAQIELSTGKCLHPENLATVRVYPLRLVGDSIEIELPI